MKKFEIKNFYSKTNLGNKYGYGDQLVDDQHICIKSKWDSEKAGFCNLADNGAPVSGTKLRFFIQKRLIKVQLGINGPPSQNLSVLVTGIWSRTDRFWSVVPWVQ